MDRADDLLTALSAGDPAAAAKPHQPDSPDDFEHLLAGESPQRAASALLAAERRGEPDSGSETGSPLHRPMQETSAPVFRTPEPDLLMEEEEESPRHSQPAPLTPEPAVRVPEPELPAPLLPSKPEEPHKEPTPPKVEIPKPEPPKVEPPKPEPPKVDYPKPVEPPKPEPPKASTPKPEPPRAPAHVIEAEVIFCRMGLDAWFDPQRLHPEVESLLYWRNPIHSGIALGSGLVLLVALAICSAVSVLAHVALLLLGAAVACRVYRSVMQAVQKTNEGHPFKELLEKDISVGAERAQELAVSATAHLNAASNELRRLFLVEDLVDSLKFGVLLWCLTYVGACFNGITLLIMGWISLFTLPKAYEMNKAQVDSNLELARAKINEITAKVRAAVPLGKKAESDKEK